ncbi:hypothetical protein [Streptomyces hygroscopicus]|uniref:hypothetical protein n=1 Tax=Streptomyces hygroscopicus TaxID=1912 RepID=UPI0007671107|nr:hypothetical protein [Streptomyces hygroscopicus]
MAASEAARPFQLHLADGRVWHGAQFPGGHVCLNHPGEETWFTVAVSLDALLGERHPEDPLHGARVEWPG